MEIRLAEVADARGIAAARRAGWQTAYAGIVPASVLDAMDLDQMTAGHRRMFTAGTTTTFVSVVDDEVTGFADFGPSRDDVDGAELYAIYLWPHAWGSGAGQALLDAGLAALPDVPVILWVLTQNARARRFYARNGFVPDGAAKGYEIGGVTIPEVRLRLER